MEFLNVKGEQYIKVSSVQEVLDELEKETMSSDGVPDTIKTIVSNMMTALKTIFNSAAGSEKETLKTEKIDVVEGSLDDDIVKRN